MQKLMYAILMTKRKNYFDAHPITVVSKYPLGEVIQNLEAEGRIAKWAIELMGQNINYTPRSAMKSQVLADTDGNGHKPTGFCHPKPVPVRKDFAR
jgi:hypothetical protein